MIKLNFLKLKRHIFYVLICLCVNLLFFHFGLSTFRISWDNPVKISGDATGYLNSVERLLDNKDFTFQKTNEDTEFVSNFSDKENYNPSVYYAFRSPGFAFFYLPLRFLFEKQTAILIFLFLQVLITAIAKYVIARTGELISGDIRVFYCIFIVLNISPYFTQFNNLLLTEALGFSFLGFSLYYTVKAFRTDNETFVLDKKRVSRLIIGGCFLTVAIMLRPFLALFAILIALYCVIYFLKEFNKVISLGLIYFSSLILVVGVWSIRNYQVTGKFIPLAGTMEFHAHKHKSMIEFQRYSEARGLSDRWFHKDSPVFWLVTAEDKRDLSELLETEDSFSDNALVNDFKRRFHESLDSSVPLEKRKTIEKQLTLDLREINEQYEAENNFEVNVKYPMLSTWHLLDQNNVRFFHHVRYPFNVVLVFTQSIILSFTFIIGVFSSIILLFWKRTKRLTDLIIPGALLLVVYFGFIEQLTETREVYTYSSVFVLSSILLLNNIFNWNRKIFFYFGSLILGITLLLGFYKTMTEINW